MGDLVSAVVHVRETVHHKGSWMIVEPMAQEELAGNLNPVVSAYFW